MSKPPSRRFPVTVTQLPVTRCQICHRTVAYRPGTLTEVLTEHYRRAHPEALDLASRRPATETRPRHYPAVIGPISVSPRRLTLGVRATSEDGDAAWSPPRRLACAPTGHRSRLMTTVGVRRDRDARRCCAGSYDERVTTSSARPVVLRDGIGIEDPLRVVLGLLKTPGRFDVSDPARPSTTLLIILISSYALVRACCRVPRLA